MAHTAKALCYTVTGSVVSQGKTLLIFHKEYQEWFTPGGHIEADEDPESAVYREIFEETGLTKKDLIPVVPKGSFPKEGIFSDEDGKSQIVPYFIDIHRVSETHHHLGLRYIFKTKRAVVAPTNDEDITNIKWFSEKELKDLKYKLRKHVKFYSLFAIKAAEGYSS